MRAVFLVLGAVLAFGLLPVAGDGSVAWPVADDGSVASTTQWSCGRTPYQQGDGFLSGVETYCYVLDCWCASPILLCCAYWCWTGWWGYTYTQCTLVPWCDPDWVLPYWHPDVRFL